MAVKKSTAKSTAKSAVKSATNAVSKATKTITKTVGKAAKAIEKMDAGKDVEILLRQHVGKPCAPIVKKGDKVAVGQLIATPQGLGANIHSSVNGKVKEVTENAIIITPSSTLTLIGQLVPDKIKADSKDMLACVTEAGVVGMGGAGFPTGIKLSTDLKGGFILVNAAECEPLLSHNMEQILKYPEETIKGVHYAMKIANASKGIIAIKQKHKKEIETLLAKLSGITDIHLHLLPDIYPMGDERAIVRECLGKLLPVTDLPAAAGAHVCNVETIFRVYEAIELRRPVVSKNVTVVGKMKWGTTPKVLFDVPIGMKVRDVLEMAGGIDGKYGEIIMGGPFMGKPCNLDDPITKTTGGLIVTEPFKDLKGEKMGILVCACGGNEDRLKDLVKKYNATLVGETQFCKQALDPKGNGMRKCENPGNCPGQALKCMNIKKAGAKHILISNCSDCTNTVMGSAPGLGLEVHHETDHVFETVGMEPMRHLTKSKFIEGPIPEGCTASRNPEEHAKDGFLANIGGVDGATSGGNDYDKPYVFRESTDDGDIVFSIESGKDIKVSFE